MDRNELVSVYSLKNPSQAEVVRVALEAEGIVCHLDGEGQAGLTGIFDIDVLVRAEDAERARDLIKAHEPIETDDTYEGEDLYEADELQEVDESPSAED